jgi:putative SOS response-associated peptidase YedK
VAGIIGLRGPDIEKRDALRGYQVDFVDAARPIIRPHTGAPVLYVKDERVVVERHVFGFSKEFTSFNARADRLEESRMWSRMFGKSHGVAPVSYILEWSDIGDGVKRPYRIERTDGAAMAVPALVGPYLEDRAQRGFALVTVPPNDFVSFFHDRVVAQLADDQIDVWLHPERHDKGALFACLSPGANEDLIAYPIRQDVGAADEDDADAVATLGEPIAWADVQARRAKVKRTKQLRL